MNKELLKTTLLKWDRKHTDFLINIYGENLQNPCFISDIIEIYSTNIELEHSTSWIIKHHVDNGKDLEQEQTKKMLQKIGELNYWESQLHLLQIIPKVSLTERQVESIEAKIRKLLNSEKKFVKAAAYEAYFEVVNFFPELKNEFRIICEEAIDKESASVKVKIKRILNKLITGANNVYSA
jgi:hypothetical protein